MSQQHRLRLEVESQLINFEEEFILTGDYLIGRRSYPSPFILIPLPYISRCHARLVKIREREGSFSYRLLDGDKTSPSSNGTYVNGIKIKVVNLKSGDEIWFGQPNPLYVAKAVYTIKEEEEEMERDSVRRTLEQKN